MKNLLALLCVLCVSVVQCFLLFLPLSMSMERGLGGED
jgi:hypothetical protein